MELIVKNLPLEKTLGQVGFASEFCLTCKKRDVISTAYTLLEKIKKGNNTQLIL